MKKFKVQFAYLTLILGITISFFGCSDDSIDEPPVPEKYDLSVTISPSESGTVSPSNGSYTEGTSVKLTGTPSQNYEFKEWKGDVTGTTNPATVKMTSNKSISVVFELKDTDGDGVTDDKDKCSDTPDGETVDENGCSSTQTDSDGDGVTDEIDQCNDTPIGEAVDDKGCSSSQIDTDGDGIMDDLDQCSDTPIGENVDENGCSIQLTYVPDNQFEQYLIDIDLDDILDDYVVTSKINTVSHIYIDENYTHNVSDLTGIEDFTMLQFLTVKGKNLTALNVTSNIELKEIDVWGNQISGIDVSNSINLTDLKVGNNRLSSIDLTKNTKLRFLDCLENQITSIDLGSNIELTDLWIGSNKISEIDLNNNSKLAGLNINDNNLTQLDINSLGYFEYLYCNDNQLNSLDLSNNSISRFQCINNQITCIEVNQDQLNQSSTNDNWFKDQDAVYSTDCSDPNAGKTYVPDNNFEQALIDLGYDDIMDDYVDTYNISGLTFLSLEKKNISDLTGIEDFVNLIQLFALQNNLSSIDVTSNTKLQTLILDGNNLTSIDISTLNNLFALTISLNNLTSINTSNNPNLYSLSCGSNKITSLDLSQNLNLDTFYCSDNLLSSLDVSYNNNLTDSTGENQFQCQNNPLSCIKVNENQLNNIPSDWVKDDEDAYSLECE